MMPARRCTTHGNWPVGPEFHVCPECDVKTDWVTNAEPMDASEVNHRRFDVFCKKRDAERDAQTQEFEAAWEAAPVLPDPSGAEDLPPLPEAMADEQKPEGD